MGKDHFWKWVEENLPEMARGPPLTDVKVGDTIVLRPKPLAGLKAEVMEVREILKVRLLESRGIMIPKGAELMIARDEIERVVKNA